VVKTSDDSGRKVFLNICSSDAVTAPGNWEGGAVPAAVRAHLEDPQSLEALSGADAEHLRFPLSLGEPRNDLDRQGDPCTVLDCVFNTDVVRGAQSLRALKVRLWFGRSGGAQPNHALAAVCRPVAVSAAAHACSSSAAVCTLARPPNTPTLDPSSLQVFIVEVAMGWVQHKCSLVLDQRFKLPKLRYKGDTIAPQNIRRSAKALVTELPTDEPDAEPSLPLRVAPIPKGKSLLAATPSAAPAAAPAATSAPAERLSLEVQYHGAPCSHVAVRGELPASRAWAAADVSVRASLDSVHVSAEGLGPQAVQLNVYVQPESARVELAGGALTVTLQYYPMAKLLGHMRANKPFAAGALSLASQSMLDELDD